tara:strand:+ start:4356 stop:5621 length:1266 start_codon:yes stop_codon:yes gene_type:complete
MKFKHIVPGYLGIDIEELTLNASYFSIVLCNNYNFYGDMLFPQRIPRSGFFNELFESGDDSYLKFKRIQDRIANLISKTNGSISQYRINLLKTALRLGMFELVYTHSNVKPVNSKSSSYEIDESLIYFVSEINSTLSVGGNVDLSTMFEYAEDLVKLYYANNTKPKFSQAVIKTLNRCIVSSYRYSDPRLYSLNNDIFLKIVEDNYKQAFEESAFGDCLYLSILFRGICMHNKGDNEFVNSCLKKSLYYANLIEPKNLMESILKKENLYTLYQTKTKVDKINHGLERSIDTSMNLLRLDPFDSTGWLERGLLLYEYKRVKSALEHFKTASELGPPGVAMNLFFVANCHFDLQQYKDAIAYYRKSILADRTAVSSYLGLYESYKKANMTCEAKEIAAELLRSTDLSSQLEDHELSELKSIVS